MPSNLSAAVGLYKLTAIKRQFLSLGALSGGVDGAVLEE
jgi:hypothetical protein